MVALIERVGDRLGSRRVPLFAVAAALVLTAPSLWAGLLIDDWLHELVLTGKADVLAAPGMEPAMFNFTDGDPARVQWLKDIGFLPWWTYEKVHLRFWRPLTELTHRLDYALWPRAPFLMHLHNLAWFGAAVFAVGLLYRRVMRDAYAAGLAVVLFAIEDAHAMPVAWVSNRNTLIAFVFGVLAIQAHVRWRRYADRRAGVMAVLLLLLALFAKESAIAVCAYLAAYALCLDPDRWRGRLASLLPYAGLVVAWRTAYVLLGHGIYGSPTYVDPLRSPLMFIAKCFERGPVLLSAQWFVPAADLYLAMPDWGKTLFTVFSAATLVVLVWLLWPLLRRDRIARFWFAGMVLAVIPFCATFPSERLLFFVGLGAMGLLAQFFSGWASGKLAWGERPSWLRAARVFVVAMVAVHVVAAPLLLPVRVGGLWLIGGSVRHALEHAPLPDDLTGKTLVLPNAPNVLFSSYLPALCALEGRPLPQHVRHIGPNNVLPAGVEMTVVDRHTVRVRPEGGYRWMLVRNQQHPLPAGHREVLPGMTAEVLRVNAAGYPAEVEYRFDAPLDDPGLIWLVFEKGRYVGFDSPAPGETVFFEGL